MIPFERRLDNYEPEPTEPTRRKGKIGKPKSDWKPRKSSRLLQMVLAYDDPDEATSAHEGNRSKHSEEDYKDLLGPLLDYMEYPPTVEGEITSNGGSHQELSAGDGTDSQPHEANYTASMDLVQEDSGYPDTSETQAVSLGFTEDGGLDESSLAALDRTLDGHSTTIAPGDKQCDSSSMFAGLPQLDPDTLLKDLSEYQPADEPGDEQSENSLESISVATTRDSV